MKAVLEEASLPASQELAAMRADIEALRRENGELRADLAGLRGDGTRTEEPMEVLQAQIQTLVQGMADLQRRFTVLEGIALRPPLAASRAVPAASAAEPAASFAAVAAAPVAGTSRRATAPEPAKGKAAKPRVVGAPAACAAAQRSSPPPPPPTDAETPTEPGWRVAGEGKKAAKAARAAKKRQRRQERRKAKSLAARLRAPKSAAVVITLQPDAEKKGVTYGAVLAKAKAAVNLAEIGAAEGVRLRVTATGARMLEVPGVASGPVADALAEKLRASLQAEEVRVSRPTMRIDMRVTGLDDSVTSEELVAAVTKAGSCPASDVRVGAIRFDRSGLGAVIVSCPVPAAKAIAGKGHKLLVGDWTSAQVKLLEPKPLRCFRCQVGHHVGVRCTSEVDRSGDCFRCGQPGHKAGSCTAAPHCSACAAAGKPADHRAGGRACAPPARTRGKGGKPSAAAPAAAAAPAPAAAEAPAAPAAAASAAAAATTEAAMECQ